MTYKSPLWMSHIEDLIRELRVEGDPIADRLEVAARHDQHDQHHDAEFHEGCEYCDAEREKYG